MTEQRRAGPYRLMAELGPGSRGKELYLAEDPTTTQLVVVQVEGGDGRVVEVMHALGEDVPARNRRCPACHAALLDWRRFCEACGTDLAHPGTPEQADPAPRLLKKIVDATCSDLTVLGEMPRAEGGAPVLFARDTLTQEIVALRLEGSDRPEPIVQREAAYAGVQRGASGHAADTDPGNRATCPTCGTLYRSAPLFCPRDGTRLRQVTSAHAFEGTVLADRYSVIREIGRGGMGRVFLCEHLRMGRRCAIKILKPGLVPHEDQMRRFGREAASASRISHPNIATIYDFGETPDHLMYLVMELVDGHSLTKLVESGPVAPERVCEIGRQIADALAAAHREGVAHRDLKPDNVLLTRSWSGGDLVKVVDFGIAKIFAGDGDDNVTATGFVIGTPRYMSPEQLAGETLDGRSDIFSLGCILFELLTGRPAFTPGPTPAESVLRRLTTDSPRPGECRPDVPRDLDQIVARSMARFVPDRYQTAEEMRDALAGAAARLSAVAVRQQVPVRTEEREHGEREARTPPPARTPSELTRSSTLRRVFAATAMGLLTLAVAAAVVLERLRAPITPAIRPTPSETLPPPPVTRGVDDAGVLLVLGQLPADAIATIDDNRGGPVERKLLLSTGRHSVAISAAGYETATWSDSIAPGQTVTWAIELTRSAGAAESSPDLQSPRERAVVLEPQGTVEMPPAPLPVQPTIDPEPRAPFDVVAEQAAREFAALLEAGDADVVARRFRMSSDLAADVRAALERSRSIQAGIWRVSPDSAAARILFYLRANDRQSGDPIWEWTEFQIDLTRTAESWQVLSIHRR